MSYRSMAGPEDLWIMKRNWQIKFLLSQGLLPHHELLDLGCGPLRGGIPIIEYLDISNYHGLDYQRTAIVAAKIELRDNGLEWKHPKLNTLQLAMPWMQFDFIWIFSVMMHVYDDDIDTFFNFVRNSLKPDGVAFANVNYRKSNEQDFMTKWGEFPVLWRSFDFYAMSAKGMNIEEVALLKELGHNSGRPDQDNQMVLKFTRIKESDSENPLGDSHHG